MSTVYTKIAGSNSWAALFSISLLLLHSPGQLLASDTTVDNPENGMAIAERKCDDCHGLYGISDSEEPEVPHLAGQSADYLLKQMKDYKSLAREDVTMYRRVRKLSEQELKDISLWYASQALPEIKPPVMEELTVPHLVTTGDPDRAIAPCEVCHGKDGKKVAGNVPVLAGQSFTYMVNTLKNFQDGSRSNDPGGVVQAIVKNMTDEEIEAIARYYAALGGRPVE